MVDGGEYADNEQSEPDLEGRAREGRGDGGEADANEEHAHHALAAPLVGEPAGGQREYAEGEEAGRGVFQQLGVAEPPFAVQRQRRHRGEDQREQVVEKMTDVEQQEVQALAHEGLPRAGVGRPRGAKLPPPRSGGNHCCGRTGPGPPHTCGGLGRTPANVPQRAAHAANERSQPRGKA